MLEFLKSLPLPVKIGALVALSFMAGALAVVAVALLQARSAGRDLAKEQGLIKDTKK